MNDYIPVTRFEAQSQLLLQMMEALSRIAHQYCYGNGQLSIKWKDANGKEASFSMPLKNDDTWAVEGVINWANMMYDTGAAKL